MQTFDTHVHNIQIKTSRKVTSNME